LVAESSLSASDSAPLSHSSSMRRQSTAFSPAAALPGSVEPVDAAGSKP